MKNNTLIKSIIVTTLFLLLPGTGSAQSFLDKVLKGVEKTNKILDETDKMLGNDNDGTSSQSHSKRTKGFQIVSPHPDLEIKVTRCIAAGSKVIIDFVLTNYASDVNIDLGNRGSVAFDDLGNQYPNFSAAGGGDPEWTATTLYPTDVPVKCRMWINNVKSDATTFKRINLIAYCPTLGMTYQNPIMFYNLPITRKDNSATLPPAEPARSSNEEVGTAPATVSSGFTHPLIDPLICTSYPIPPVAIIDISYIDNDWNKLGLKGHVKQITETAIYGNENNPPQQTSYIFQENGMLNSIETSDEMYLFTYQNNNLTKILSYDKKKNTTNEYTSPFAKDLHYNEQGQLIENTFGLHTFFSYDDQGACSKITYDDEFPENLAAVTTTFTRNSQGDIRSIHTKTVFHEETTDSNGNRVKGAIEVTSEETCTIEYKYDNHGNWTSMLTGKCPTKYIQAKRIIEYYN